MKNHLLRFSPSYLIAFILLFITETGIALYIHDRSIRPYVGDMLVVILVYTFIRIFYAGSKKLLPVYVFLFAVFIEICQWINIVKLLRIQDNAILTTALGTSFDWMDILCYLSGTLLIYALGISKNKFDELIELYLKI